MKIILFNDQPELLYPLTRLRPTWEVNVGGRSLIGILKRNFPGVKIELVDPKNTPRPRSARPPLLIEGTTPRSNVRRDTPLDRGDYNLYLNGRLLPNDKLIKSLQAAIKAEAMFVLKKKGAVLIQSNGLKTKKINTSGIELMQAPWDFIRWHKEIILQEVNYRGQTTNYKQLRKNIFADKSVTLPDTCITRTKNGLIVIEKGVQVGDFTILEGPLLLEEKIFVHDYAKLSRSRIGSACKVNGEIADCNFYPYSNMQHAGFAGNSIIGSWANLGGGSITSNLKNTWGNIRIDRGMGPETTKLQFAGSILGDHVKTGINSTLMTGLVADVNAHLYGTAKGFIPAFANSVNGKLTELPLEVALKTARRMMLRRNVKLSAAERKNLRDTFKQTGDDRRKLKVSNGKLEL